MTFSIESEFKNPHVDPSTRTRVASSSKDDKSMIPQVTDSTIIGRVQGFVGIYSGRIKGETEFEAQLGIVWKAKVIEEIISGGVFDSGNYF